MSRKHSRLRELGYKVPNKGKSYIMHSDVSQKNMK